jgi:hypothetical protein
MTCDEATSFVLWGMKGTAPVRVLYELLPNDGEERNDRKIKYRASEQ